MRYDAPFFQVPRTPHDTSQGSIELPILYGDVEVAYAFFRADEGAVAPMLDDTGLQALPYASSRCVVGVACFAYHDSTVGAYNEVGVVVPVVPRGQQVAMGGLPEMLRTLSRPEERHAGFHVLHLPVTTAIANAGGRELWGYPKFVTEIEMTLRSRTLSCAVQDPEGHGRVMRLHGRLGVGLPMPALSLLTYSLLDGKVLRTTVDARGGMRAHAGGGVRLEVGPSEHPMAQTLTDLGLGSATPVAVLTTDAFQSRLNAGVPIGSVIGRPVGAATPGR